MRERLVASTRQVWLLFVSLFASTPSWRLPYLAFTWQGWIEALGSEPLIDWACRVIMSHDPCLGGYHKRLLSTDWDADGAPEALLSKEPGRARVDGRRVLILIIYINFNYLSCLDVPVGYGLPKTLYNLWGDLGRLQPLHHCLEVLYEHARWGRDRYDRTGTHGV